MSASSVAPAKVGPTAEPLIAISSAAIPNTVIPQPLAVVADPSALPADAPVIEVDADSDEVAEETVSPKADLATMVAELRSSNPGSRELECLAAGVYFESKSEPLIGQLAVGEVIANRASSGRFPSTYCGVLFQRGQFSFVRGGKLPPIPRASRQWQTAVAIAKIVDRDLKDSAADNALFFHARHVSPKWKLKRVASIGNHIFYR
ncbi:MAG TPA: cell wall hydrolase [Sphingomicrobium sp.]|nr:cell wall hydrolase [Sphingomicrobium sp.]